MLRSWSNEVGGTMPRLFYENAHTSNYYKSRFMYQQTFIAKIV